MMILLTGQPGHGKSAYMITRIVAYLKEGRDVYQHGIKNFNFDKANTLHETARAHYLEDPTKWQDLPDGSVVVLDECYSAFPNRNPGAKVPEHVEKLATHRHRGFDFIFVAQQSIQIDPFMKGLFEEHIHVKKKIGRYRKLLRWSSFQSNVKSLCTDDQDWLMPSWPFEYFTSTVLNTSKNRIPKWIIVIGASVLVVVLLALFLRARFAERTAKSTAPASESAAPFAPRGTSGAGGAASLDQPKWETVTDYATAHLPRFGSMPWTAPVYDQRALTTDPQLFCMSSHEGQGANGEWLDFSCTCYTEQGTLYEISQPECRRVARYGAPYNAYKAVGAPMPPQQPQPSPVASTPLQQGVVIPASGL